MQALLRRIDVYNTELAIMQANGQYNGEPYTYRTTPTGTLVIEHGDDNRWFIQDNFEIYEPEGIYDSLSDEEKKIDCARVRKCTTSLENMPRPTPNIKDTLRLARVLVDMADDLIHEHADPIITSHNVDELNRWRTDCFGAIVNAHNTLNAIYMHDPAFMTDGEEQAMRVHFEQAIANYIEKKGGEA